MKWFKKNIIANFRYLWWNFIFWFQMSCFGKFFRNWDLYYSLKCYFFKRYSTIRARYLPHTWVDRDILLYHLMFEILSDFVEKEGPLTLKFDCDIDCKGWEKANKQLMNLYNWWHDIYIKFDDCNWERREAMDIELKNRAHQLINLSGYMWT